MYSGGYIFYKLPLKQTIYYLLFGTIATVSLLMQFNLPLSVIILISQTWVLAPMCKGLQMPVTKPDATGRK